MRRKSQRGMTLVELIVAFTIMMLLTAMSVPLLRYRVQLEKERDLTRALEQIRNAIDKFKDDMDTGKIGPAKLDSDNYPESLKQLVDGIKATGSVDKKMRYLRRIPKDPMTNSTDWGLRSTQDDVDSQTWGGQNVFDVYTKSTDKARDGTPYSEWYKLRDAARRRQGKRALFGFTFVELMIVMAIIVILLRSPFRLQPPIIRAKESVLKNNLFTMRTVIDEYTYDKQKAPQSLEDLVTDGYLREVPLDPMTGSADSWKIIQEDQSNTVNQQQPGIYDVRSGSDKTSLEGTPYSDW